MKAAPLLRAWIRRLRTLGVRFQMNHQLASISRDRELIRLAFQSPNAPAPVEVEADAAILALGGGSWPQTGSTGQWIPLLADLGIAINPLQPANCGWELPWPPELLAAAEGRPLKNVALSAAGLKRTGELVITRYGLEGGPLYHLGPVLRTMEHPSVVLDLKPTHSLARVRAKLAGASSNYVREAKRRLKLNEAAAAILRFLPGIGPWRSPEILAAAIKNCPIPLLGPRPLPEAISSAGGVAWDELDDALMLRRVPGLFVAGEMIDWEAPTGGYLIHACFATGGHAAASALRWIEQPGK